MQLNPRSSSRADATAKMTTMGGSGGIGETKITTVTQTQQSTNSTSTATATPTATATRTTTATKTKAVTTTKMMTTALTAVTAAMTTSMTTTVTTTTMVTVALTMTTAVAGGRATSAADGVVWGRRQAAEVAEMGINRKWEQWVMIDRNFYIEKLLRGLLSILRVG